MRSLVDLLPNKTNINGEKHKKHNHFKIWNCSREIQHMKKHLFKNLLYLDKNSENLWHLSHDLLPPSSPKSIRQVPPWIGMPGTHGSMCPWFLHGQRPWYLLKRRMLTALLAPCSRGSLLGDYTWELKAPFLQQTRWRVHSKHSRPGMLSF